MVTWDEKKRKKVIEAHGVDLAKIADIFDDPHAVYIEDPDHDDLEQRWLVIARSSEYGLICAVMTFRGDDFRLITARLAERWMAKRYERQRKRI